MLGSRCSAVAPARLLERGAEACGRLCSPSADGMAGRLKGELVREPSCFSRSSLCSQCSLQCRAVWQTNASPLSSGNGAVNDPACKPLHLYDGVAAVQMLWGGSHTSAPGSRLLHSHSPGWQQSRTWPSHQQLSYPPHYVPTPIMVALPQPGAPAATCPLY